MHTYLQRVVVCAVFVCVSSTAAVTINDLMPGKVACGQNLAAKDLKGKVVFVAYWGVDCPHCIAEIPQWIELYKKYHAAGLEIVGMERHRFSEATITTLARSKGIEFTLTMGGSLNGATVTSIPHGFLFGTDGNLVQENPYGTELETKLAALLKDSITANAVLTQDSKLKPAISRPQLAPESELKATINTSMVTKFPTDASNPQTRPTCSLDTSKECAGAALKFENLCPKHCSDAFAFGAANEQSIGACGCTPDSKSDLTFNSLLRSVKTAATWLGRRDLPFFCDKTRP